MTQTLVDQLHNALWNHHQPIYLLLLRVLATGQPVAPQDIASTLDMPVEEVIAALRGFTDIEYNQEGHVVAAGLSLNPTPYRLQINHQTLFAWCALDTLMYPVLLQQAMQVGSKCPVTGIPVRLTVTPTQIMHLMPANTVVSMVAPTASMARRGTRKSFCDLVLFISSMRAATTWRSSHPEATILTVEEAYELGRVLARRRLDSGQSCCP
jgi:alkylmercury lyase